MATRCGAPLAHRSPSCGRRLRWFVHKAHGYARSPGTHRKVHGSANLGSKGTKFWNGDGGHLDEAAMVCCFDLEDVPQRNDLPGFLVGATAEGGCGSEDALKNQHGFLSVDEGFNDLRGTLIDVVSEWRRGG